MRCIEQATNIKAETLKRYLETVRKLGLPKVLDRLLQDEAGISEAQLAELDGFWAECELTPQPYWYRGQHFVRYGRSGRALRPRSARAAQRRPARRR